MFDNIKVQLMQDADKQKKDAAELIENGYLNSWAPEHHKQSDGPLQRYSTATRWDQYTAGKITRKKAADLAIQRAYKEIDKRTAEKFGQLEEAENAPDLVCLSISVDWFKSQYWGYNPHAAVYSPGQGITTGKASGCGYDKKSAAVAQALNANKSVLKALYSYKDARMQAGESDYSPTTCTGHDNRNIIGYGAGYNTIPAFEGGVGVECFWEIFKKLGYRCSVDESQRLHDSYMIFK